MRDQEIYAQKFSKRFFSASTESFESFVYDLQQLFKKAYPDKSQAEEYTAVKEQLLRSLPTHLRELNLSTTENNLDELIAKIRSICLDHKILFCTEKVILTQAELVGRREKLLNGQEFTLKSFAGYLTVLNSTNALNLSRKTIGRNQTFTARVISREFSLIIAIRSTLNDKFLSVSDYDSYLYANKESAEEKSDMFEVYLGANESLSLRSLKKQRFLSINLLNQLSFQKYITATAEIPNLWETFEIH